MSEVCDSAHPAIFDPHVIHVRKLHKKTSRSDLMALAEPFGAVKSINIWYGWGMGVIEMKDAKPAASLLTAFRDVSAYVHGKAVVLGPGIAVSTDQAFKQSPSNPKVVEKEIARCVS